MLPVAGLLGGAGGGTSVNPTATSNTDVKTGSLAQTFGFGGINTGTQGALPPWAVPVAIAGVVLLGAIYLWRR